jgi:putative transposase
MHRKLSPRVRNFDYLGPQRYFLTICAKDRRRVFVTDAAVTLVSTDLLRTADARAFAVVAYCFMPDHLHVLVEGADVRSDFREFVRVFKQRSGFVWKQRHGDTLWQRSYFERVLRRDENTVTVARYILANPVRAGLVERAEDYPFLGSGMLTLRDLLYSVQVM